MDGSVGKICASNKTLNSGLIFFGEKIREFENQRGERDIRWTHFETQKYTRAHKERENDFDFDDDEREEEETNEDATRTKFFCERGELSSLFSRRCFRVFLGAGVEGFRGEGDVVFAEVGVGVVAVAVVVAVVVVVAGKANDVG